MRHQTALEFKLVLEQIRTETLKSFEGVSA